MSEVRMEQSVMYCGAVLPATWRMLATSNVWCVDAPVRHVLWCSVLQTSILLAYMRRINASMFSRGTL